MEGKKVIAYQTDDDQSKPEGIALDEGDEGITDKTDEHEQVEKGKNVIEHYCPNLSIKIPILSLIYITVLPCLCKSG